MQGQWREGTNVGSESDADKYTLLKVLKDSDHVTLWLAQKLNGERAPGHCVLKQIKAGTINEQWKGKRHQLRAAEIGAMIAAFPDKVGYVNLVKVYGCGEWAGQPYLEMEYLDGESLDVYLSQMKGELPAEEVLSLALQLCDALSFLEELPAGITHRDVTTSNIMLVKHRTGSDLTSSDMDAANAGKRSAVLGKRLVLVDLDSALRSEDPLEEIPPDLVDQLGDPANRRVYDIYLAALVIAEMKKGRSIKEDLDRIALEKLLPGKDAFSKALRQALDIDPANRPQSAQAFRQMLTVPQKAGLVDRVMLVLRKGSTSTSVSSGHSVDMVRIDAGNFMWGAEPAEGRGQPGGNAHGVIMQAERMRSIPSKAFDIDLTPVTNRQYMDFIRKTGWRDVPYQDSPLARPYNWDRKEKCPPAGLEDHPVVLVSWADAAAYAKWRNKRLPTEKEWEKAARGELGWAYPWGPDWDRTRCNNLETLLGRDLKDPQAWYYFMKALLFDLERWPKVGAKTPSPVLTTPVMDHAVGASPYGIFDMVGNVWEWTADSPPGGDSNYRIVRGGSWLEGCEGNRTTARLCERIASRMPWIGFRCAKDVPAKG